MNVYRRAAGTGVLTPDGLFRMRISSDAAEIKIGLKGLGGNLDAVAPPFSPPLTVQLRAAGGDCWTAVFPTLRFNDPEKVAGALP